MGNRAARAWNPANVSITGGNIGGVTGVALVPSSFQSYTAVVAPADTAENIVATLSLSAGELGLNGGVFLDFYATCTNNTNVKTIRVRIGGIGGTVIFTRAITSLDHVRGFVNVGNSGSASVQQYDSYCITSTPALAITGSGTAAINTANATTIVITAEKATGSDTVTLIRYNGMKRLPGT